MGWQRAWLLLAIWFALLLYVDAAEHEFRFKRPEAQSVSLMGEFNGWKGQPMTKGDDGFWTAKVSLGTGIYAYKFLVNGTDWILDSESAAKKLVDGVENSAVEITEAASAVTPRPSATPESARVSPLSRLTSSVSPSAALGKETLTVTPGELLIREVPLSAKRRAQALADGNPKLIHARIGLAVPPDFAPQKSWPILAICNTEAYANIDSLRQFKDAAIAEGWVVVAADAVEAEKDKEGANRSACFGAAFDYLLSAWPAAKGWPVATGGMSGGGKNGAFVAVDLARENRRVIGMLMMGCNEDMATVAYRQTATPASFLNAAVFLSSGKSDQIATPAQHERVKNSIRGTGFSKVRLESFDGAHDINQPHIGEALRWFVEQGGTSSASPTPRKSELDGFFKKKP